MSDSAPQSRLDILDTDAHGSASAGRPFLQVNFACCNVYQRIYRNPQGTAYQGRCPRCGKPVRFLIGQGGTDARNFIVY